MRSGIATGEATPKTMRDLVLAAGGNPSDISGGNQIELRFPATNAGTLLIGNDGAGVPNIPQPAGTIMIVLPEDMTADIEDVMMFQGAGEVIHWIAYGGRS